MSSIFTKIINGDLPGSFVYQDLVCSVFMDIHPFAEGHLLVVPKEETARFSDLPSETAAHLFRIAHKIVCAINSSKISPDGYNLFLSDGEIAGQEVPHCHLHILPRKNDDKIHLSFGIKAEKCDRKKLNLIANLISESCTDLQLL